MTTATRKRPRATPWLDHQDLGRHLLMTVYHHTSRGIPVNAGYKAGTPAWRVQSCPMVQGTIKLSSRWNPQCSV